MIEVADSNAAYYYHFDGQGSVVALSNSSGTTIQTYEYTIYGQVAASDPAVRHPQAENHPNPYLFTPVLAFARKHGGDSIEKQAFTITVPGTIILTLADSCRPTR